jgi:DNA-binding transcriptional regulator YiaG
MPTSSFARRLAQQGRVQAISRVTSGSPEEIVLKLGRASPDVIAAVLALAQRGTTMLKAKRAIEKVLEEGDAVIDLPTVEDHKALTGDLETAGMSVTFRSVLDRDLKEHFSARLKKLRIRLRVSQEEFARDYNLSKKTLQGWECGKKIPDHGNRNLIRMIEEDPIRIKHLVNGG